MNQQAFESGKRAYQEGDWLRALTLLDGAKQPGELSGETDHLRGNAYMKLGDFDAAAAAYEGALADSAYGKRGALSCNRGRALLAAGRTQEAVAALTEAVADASYPTPYKAYLALGGAYEQLGDVRNAGIAYRSAAIDESNPAPAGALTSLGGCFMRLGRSVDAVEAFRTALDFTTPLEDQNKIWCDLALAYVAANRMNEAVDAFAHATADGTFVLSPEAQASYDAARKAVSSIGARRPSETDAMLAAAGYASPYDPLDPTGASGELIPSPEDTGFFSVTEEDLVQQDKLDRKVRRKHRHTGLKIFVTILILVLLLTGAGVFAFTQGFGWPTQQAVAEQFFDAKTQGSDLSSYVVPGTSTTQIQEWADLIPSGAEVDVTGIDRSMTESTVYLTATLSSGGQQDYVIEMARDGIGWKVSSVSTAYLSDDSSSSAGSDTETDAETTSTDDGSDTTSE
ncbi:MAG: tetratricopeptide repeat protein [Atopobiaceae bacterium]|nr:tetratricopeptide repeat protein [Atopobiaceae bacterium]